MQNRFLGLLLIFTTLPAFFLGCGASSSGGTASSYPNSSPALYFKSTQKITVEVFYEPGAEPFTGSTSGGLNYWSILEENLTAIFQYRTSQPVIVVPKTLASMGALTAQGRTSWLGTDILALHSRTATTSPTATEARFYVYFLKGNYSSGSGPETSVIGVSLGGTPIIAIFKEVIQNSGASPVGPVPKYVEQSTLVHEMGHALGFVNNGVPMVTNHQDTAHGAHSTDSQCVMYWQNEGTSNLISFVQNYITSGNRVMWGAAVLQDAQAYSQ